MDGTAITDIPTGWYFFSVQDDVCYEEDSVFVDITNAPEAIFTPSVTGGCAPLIVDFTNQSLNSVSFEWVFGNGQTASVNDMSTQQSEFLNDAVVMLVAYDAANCSDTAYANITVEPCGCTDPNASNYNPLASIDDGSCVYPVPVVDAPNIFTPNEDNMNDMFFLDATNADNIDLVILNRWGNVVYEGSGPNPAWDGKVPSGTRAAEGTYFYKYVATGPGGDQVEGHGYVQLVFK